MPPPPPLQLQYTQESIFLFSQVGRISRSRYLELFLFIVALAPTSSKLTTQYMVMDHMKNHYSKITNAKRKYTCTKYLETI